MNDILDILANNWAVIVCTICVVAISGLHIYEFAVLPTAAQQQKVFQWLLYAVIEAESYFGEKMGVVKLRFVYDKFVERFPAVARMVSFETFSEWVDNALKDMKKLLESNANLAKYVGEDTKEVSSNG